MTKTRWIVLLVTVLLIGLIAVFFLPRDNEPAPTSRVVLEHTYRTYLAPSCFELEDPTNFLEEATLADAVELGYPPNSDCTREAFEGNRDSPFQSLMKELGIMDDDKPDW
ncbi:hypothetical protein [Planomicrobium sp. YIM 101495]|uniref:hypothetical protein n=1 Tax=Planomicrobium sp. YIM 101495 TaxID=2665160 RepID=UPI0012B7D03C|nr:hypothetical protein [Planomicrobium sp. YIM 101495]MTD31409.1 hypothetical protein [Planomicrobium sp. YIM 101495]